MTEHDTKLEQVASRTPAARGRPRAVAAGLLSIALVAILYAHGQFIRKDLAVSLVWLLPAVALAGMLTRATTARHPAQPIAARLLPLIVLAGGALLYLLSGATRHRWFYMLRWNADSLIPSRSLFAMFLLGTALLIPFFRRSGRAPRPWIPLAAIFLAGQAMAVAALLHTTGGEALYRTDHPSFMFRLWSFSQTFPKLVNYNPYWNAGSVGCVELTSGTLGPGLLLWPLLRVFPVHEVYTTGIALIYAVLVPWLACFSVRAMGGDRTAAFAGGILALGVSQHFFLWMLHYGTIGAALASAMVLPVAALTFRVVCQGRLNAWVAVALSATGSFMLLWPPAAIGGAGVALAALVNARRWTRRRVLFAAGCVAAIFTAYGGCLAVLLGEGNHVVQYVMQPAGGGGAAHGSLVSLERLTGGWHTLVAHVQEGHPLLIFFGLAGTLVAAPRIVRRWYAPILLVLAVFTGWAEQLKPHSQLSRLSIPLFFAAVAPTALQLARVLREHDPRLAIVRAGLVALLATGAFNVSLIYANRGLAPYVVMNPDMHRLVDWIRTDCPPDGRVMFAGRCVHAYGRGNVAYLPALTGREMMADDYYGFPAGTIDYEYPPRPYRQPVENMMIFLNAYNVTHILTYHEKWQQFFEQHGEIFEKAFEAPSANLTIRGYRVKRPSSLLLEGTGHAQATFNDIRVTLDGTPPPEVVLKYNWDEHLRADDGVELFPFTAGENITLIGVHPAGKRTFRIRY